MELTSLDQQKTPLLFIGGIGRSGTTVFELSLGTDARVVPLGEVIHLWQRSLINDEDCGCGVAFSRCEFWRTIGQEAFGGWEKVDARRMVLLKKRVDRTLRTPQIALGAGGAEWKSEVYEYASHYSQIYRAAAKVSGRELVVDSSKQASLPYVIGRERDIRLRVVHCVRDSRAVAYSWTKQVHRPESNTSGSTLMTRYSPSVLAAKWVQHNLVIEALRLKKVPTLRIRYEDWAAQPVETVQSTLAFAGLRWKPNTHLDDAWVDLPTTHTCSGNPMRFTKGRVEIRRDEAWRGALPRASRLLVTGITLPGLAGYRYLGKRV